MVCRELQEVKDIFHNVGCAGLPDEQVLPPGWTASDLLRWPSGEQQDLQVQGSRVLAVWSAFSVSAAVMRMFDMCSCSPPVDPCVGVCRVSTL